MANPIIPGSVSTPELAQLKDIHLPDAIGWWPPALGWILLTIVLILLLGLGIVFLLRAIHHNRSKRKALHLISQYQQDFPLKANAAQSCARLSELLKRVALVYFPRTDVAKLQGQAWIDFLTHSSRGLNFNGVSHLLTEVPYRSSMGAKDIPEKKILELFKLAKSWIKQRRRRCLN